MPGVSRFECSIVFFHIIMCCFFPLLIYAVLVNKTEWSRVQKGNLTRFFLCKCWSSATPLLIFNCHYHTLQNPYSTSGLSILFTVPVVRRTLLGTGGFSGSAPAATNGGHQKALTSRSFCKAEIMLISCVQIKMKPVEMYHPLVSWETE